MIVRGDFEIRKFYMHQDVNFISLREKLKTIFPILEITKYRLLWQEEDKNGEVQSIRVGDESDEELGIAIMEMTEKYDFCEFFIVKDSNECNTN